jgi:hypothetical protein
LFNKEVVLADIPLIPDPDSLQEMGVSGSNLLTDDEIKGCRLILTQLEAKPIKIGNTEGGVVAFRCTFHPANKIRFSQARVIIKLLSPTNLSIVDLQPREVFGEPVKITVNREGKLGFKYHILEAGSNESTSMEFQQKSCLLQGSGQNTSIAKWDFFENDEIQQGIVREQTLALTLPYCGEVGATLTISTRVARKGLLGVADTFRDLIVKSSTLDRKMPILFNIPKDTVSSSEDIFDLAMN